MQRLGTVLVFAPEVTPEEAAKALEKIRNVLDLPQTSHNIVSNGDGTCRMEATPFKMQDKIKEFDDEWGGPVWYIP